MSKNNKKEEKKRLTFKVLGLVKDISPLIRMERANTKDIAKRVLTLELADGQILYVDFINSKMNLLRTKNIERNRIVHVEWSFKGSDPSSGRRFNNIFAQNIERVEV